jgi:hypothetical protein
MINRQSLPPSIVSLGDLSRLKNVLRRASLGLPVRIAGIGGSITAGAGASTPDKRWLTLVIKNFNSVYGVVATLIDAGISGTGSDYGALRVDRDIISKNVQISFVDCSVNDVASLVPSFESLVRRLLIAPGNIAVIPIMFCNCNQQSIQDLLIPICTHYNLPTISYQNAVLAAISAGTITKAQVTSPDGIHPPDFGHAFAAQCVIDLLHRAKTEAQPPVPSATLPAELNPNAFDKTVLISNDGLKAAARTGFQYRADPGDFRIENVGVLVSSSVGDSFSVEISDIGGPGVIWLMVGVSNDKSKGTIHTEIDGNVSTITDCNALAKPFVARLFWAQMLVQVASGLTAGSHAVRVTNWPSPSQSGSFLWICGIGYTTA